MSCHPPNISDEDILYDDDDDGDGDGDGDEGVLPSIFTTNHQHHLFLEAPGGAGSLQGSPQDSTHLLPTPSASPPGSGEWNILNTISEILRNTVEMV